MPELFWYYFIFSEGTWAELNFYQLLSTGLSVKKQQFFSPGQPDNNALQLTRHFVRNKICIMVGPFVQPQSPPPLNILSQCHLYGSRHPHSTRASLSWVLRNTHLWFIPDPSQHSGLCGLAWLLCTMVHQKENEIKSWTSAHCQGPEEVLLHEWDRIWERNTGSFLYFESKWIPQNIWFWKAKIESYMAFVSFLGESWCFPTQNYLKNVLGMSQCWQLSLSIWYLFNLLG